MELNVPFLLVSLILIIQHFAIVRGSCVFPKDLRGKWISSEKKTINFTATSITNYPLNVFNGQIYTMICIEQEDDIYLLKSVGGIAKQSIFICFEIHRISDDKYWYQTATENSATDNDRFVLSFNETIDTACNRKRPFSISTFNTLVKEGAFEQGRVGVMCPPDVYNTFSQGTLSSSGGGMCTNNVLDVCGNRTHIRFTYGSSCRPALKIANEGSYVCLLAFTDPSGVTYLHIWNNDTSTPINGVRINCLAYRATDTTLQATLYPAACWPNQTDTVVGGDGIKMQFNNITKTCKDVHVVKPSLIGLYAGIGGGVLAFILLLILTIYIINKTRCRCASALYKKIKIDNSDKLLANGKTMSIAERNGLFAANNTLTPVVIPELYPPIKVELLYAVESKLISCKPVFDKTKLGSVVIPKMEPPNKVDLLYKVNSKTISKKVTFDASVFLSDLSLKVH